MASPKRVRNYKAEYAAAKRRAQAAGYASQREYKAARKSLGTPRNASPLPKRVATNVIRANRDDAAKAWSNAHSQNRASRFNSRWGQTRKDTYDRVFVNPSSDKRKWFNDFRSHLVPEFYTNEEFDERYGYILN